MSFRLGFCVAGFVLLLPSSGFGQEVPNAVDVLQVLRGDGHGLTADDVARRALDASQGVEAARAQRRAAEAGAARAYLGFFPRVQVGARYTRLSEIQQPSLFTGPSSEQLAALQALAGQVTDPAARTLLQLNLESQLSSASFRFPVLLNMWNFEASVQYSITAVLFQVLPGYEALERVVDAQRAQLLTRRADVAAQAREAFYNYSRARAAVAVAESALATVEDQARLVAAFVAAGTAPAVDLARVQAQLEGARVAVLRGRGGVEAASEALHVLMGEAGGETVYVGEDLLAIPPATTTERSELISQALALRPEAEALRRMGQARQRQAQAAEGSRYPNLAVAGNFSFVNPSTRIFPQQERFNEQWDASVVLSWSPNDFFSGEIQAREAYAQAAEVQANLTALESGIRVQVIQSYENYRAARAAISAAEAGLRAAEESLRIRVAQLREGTILTTELLAANADRARAQLDLITASIDARIAHVQLQRAIGNDPLMAE